MFYKDDKGIQVCQLGTGDVMVSGIETKEGKPLGIAFGEIQKGTIGREILGMKGKLDYETGIKFKLIFTNPKSIDVVIDALKQAKDNAI